VLNLKDILRRIAAEKIISQEEMVNRYKKYHIRRWVEYFAEKGPEVYLITHIKSGGVMPAILRIDVDRAYENRILHYMRVNQELFLGNDSLGYLEPCKKLVDDLNSRGIKASLFFQPFTVPNKDFAQELMKKRHNVGLHAVHSYK